MRLTRQEMVFLAWVGTVTLLLLVPLPLEEVSRRWHALVADLENFGHPVLVAWLAHLAFRRLRASRPPPSLAPWLLVLALAAGYGVITEAAQSFVGRDSSWQDVGNDLLGAGFTLLLHARSEASGKHRRLALTGLAALIAFTSVTPLSLTLAAYVVRSIEAPVLWNDRPGLLGHFSHWQRIGLPALVVEEPLPDWREWRFLEIDLRNLEPAPLRLIVRVHDRTHDQSRSDRYNEWFTLAPRIETTLRIPLERIRTAPATRQMDMGAIRAIVVFSFGSARIPPFHVSEIRLAR